MPVLQEARVAELPCPGKEAAYGLCPLRVAAHLCISAQKNGRRGSDVPSIELATASFPCTDLSLAGNRAGLKGSESSMFWQFARVLREMDRRRPKVVMLENVPGFATSHGGKDLRNAIAELNDMGY